MTVYPSFLRRLQARSRPMRALPWSYAKILHFSELWQLDHIRLPSKLTLCQINEANRPENCYFSFNFALDIFNTLSFFNPCYCRFKNKCRANFFSTFSIAYKNLRKLPNSHSHPQNLWLALRQLLSLCSYMISLKRKKKRMNCYNISFSLYLWNRHYSFNKCPKNLTLLVSLRSNITSHWIQLNYLWSLFPRNLTHCSD